MRTGFGLRGRTTRGEAQPASSAERGAALVEMALTLTLLMMLLVGIVTSAAAYGRSNSIQNAVREASRFAATLDSVETKLDQVVNVARVASSGDLDESAPGYFICVAYVGGGSDVSVEDTTGTPVAGSGSCYSDGRTEERIQVVAQRDATINAILFSVDVTLDAEAAARYER